MTKRIQSKVWSTYKRIYAVVRKIPRGRVETYGQIATLAGLHGQPRQVGYALNNLRGIGSIPWHRVINAKGEISKRSHSGCEKAQRVILEQEGIEFDAKGGGGAFSFSLEAQGSLRTKCSRKGQNIM